MLDTKLFYEGRREYTRCKCTTEDTAEFGVQATNSHILKLEIRGEDRIGSCPSNVVSRLIQISSRQNRLFAARFDFDSRVRCLENRYICFRTDNTSGSHD